VSALKDAGASDSLLFSSAVVISLVLTAVPSIISYLMLLRPIERADCFAGTRWITYLAFAAPALYTFERVVFAGFRSTLDDRFLWVPIWAILAGIAAIGSTQKVKPQPAWAGRLKLAHGVVAAIILLTFLIVHLGTHIVGLLGSQVHIAITEILRLWYRANLVEPILVALFVFQVFSGARLAAIRQFAPGDRFRTLQVATGVGLMAFLLAHMTVIFIVARWQNNLDTNWIFATGFKVGILGSFSNSRQVPYYWFALVTTVSHLACGLRVILLTHGWRMAVVNRLTISIVGFGALVATAILAGMLGLRLG
jgi:hypothetical protein